jgi:hypothetical protein
MMSKVCDDAFRDNDAAHEDSNCFRALSEEKKGNYMLHRIKGGLCGLEYNHHFWPDLTTFRKVLQMISDVHSETDTQADFDDKCVQ